MLRHKVCLCEASVTAVRGMTESVYLERSGGHACRWKSSLETVAKPCPPERGSSGAAPWHLIHGQFPSLGKAACEQHVGACSVTAWFIFPRAGEGPGCSATGADAGRAGGHRGEATAHLLGPPARLSAPYQDRRHHPAPQPASTGFSFCLHCSP